MQVRPTNVKKWHSLQRITVSLFSNVRLVWVGGHYNKRGNKQFTSLPMLLVGLLTGYIALNRHLTVIKKQPNTSILLSMWEDEETHITSWGEHANMMTTHSRTCRSFRRDSFYTPTFNE